MLFSELTESISKKLSKRVMLYAVVIEKANGNLSAYVPDLPGCVATGENSKDVNSNIRDAIRLHLDGTREDGIPFRIRKPFANMLMRDARTEWT